MIVQWIPETEHSEDGVYTDCVTAPLSNMERKTQFPELTPLTSMACE